MNDFVFKITCIKDDCKTKLEIKKEILDDIEVQKGIEIMDKLNVPTNKNEVHDDFKAKTKVEKDIKVKVKKKRELEIVENIKNELKKGIEDEMVLDKLDFPLKNDVQSELKPKIELEFKRIKEEMEVQRGIEIIDKLDVPIKNENQDDFKAEIKVEKGIKNEIQVQLNPKIEFKLGRVKEEMEVKRGMEIIEKLDPPTKKPKLSLQGQSWQTGFFELAWRDRNMKVRFYWKVVLKF